MVDCGDPEPADFMNDTDINVTVSSTQFNGVATYTCLEEGTVVVGDNRRVCGTDGNWTGVSPTDCVCKYIMI